MVAVLTSEFVRSALESSPDALLIVDPSGTILFANHQLSAVFGYSRDEVLGQRVEFLLPERFRGRHSGHRERFAAEHRLRPMGAGLELYALRKDGSEFPVEISLSPLREGNQTLVSAAIRDVTDRKRAEQELINARLAADNARETADRERQVADRERRTADEARDIADRANQAKSRFLATASHDLRQPLQSLALLNGTLRRLVSEPDALEALAYQEQAIGAMSRLLNALLDISKLESGAIRPEISDFTVTTLFEEMRHEFASLAASKGLKLLVESHGEGVHSDPALLGQILRNLVSNAIKYTRAGSVRLASLSRAGGTVRIEVLDTGIGIPSDQLQYIYDEFYQVGINTNSSRDGYGLGLSIVRRLINLLNIRLDVQSEVGKGSVFAVELPAAHTRVEGKRQPSEAGAASSARRTPSVLLVEDDPAVRDATRMLLKVEGYRVVTAASRVEAEAYAREHPTIDLLVTDYHLGNEETGTQVISSLRRIIGDSLKAVLITGDTSTAVRELQLDERLRLASKPIQAEELLRLLTELLAS